MSNNISNFTNDEWSKKEDEWYNKYLKKLSEIEDASGKVQDIIQDHIITAVDKIIRTRGKSGHVVNMGRITVDKNNNITYQNKNYINVNNLKLPENKVAVGLISLGFKDDSAHWAAYYYDPRADRAIIYDSMQNNKYTQKNHDSYSKHSNVFKSSLAEALGIGNINITIAGCPCGGRRSSSAAMELVELARNIRPANASRQPTGGFINSPFKGQLKVAILKNEPPSNELRKEITSYRAQHHFCYIEALMFIDDMLKGSIPNSCKTSSTNGKKELIRVKSYAIKIMTMLGNKNKIPSDFNSIYNPETNNKNKI